MTNLLEGLSETPLPGLDRPLTFAEIAMAHKYLKLLIKWQQSHRLVGSTNYRWMIENVIIDSVAFLTQVPRQAQVIADIGSGAGIPGIPVAVVRPDLQMTLIESRRRRVSFLLTVVRELGLSGVQVLAARVEDLVESHRDQFDVLLMRCAGPAERILESSFGILRSGGVAILTAKLGSPSVGGQTALVQMPDGRRRQFQCFTKP